MKENKNGPPSLDMLRDMLKWEKNVETLVSHGDLFLFRDSVISEGEATTDLSDKNCTCDELENENVQVLQNIPKVVSQSNGIGTMKRSLNSEVNTRNFRKWTRTRTLPLFSRVWSVESSVVMSRMTLEKRRKLSIHHRTLELPLVELSLVRAAFQDRHSPSTNAQNKKFENLRKNFSVINLVRQRNFSFSTKKIFFSLCVSRL